MPLTELYLPEIHDKIPCISELPYSVPMAPESAVPKAARFDPDTSQRKQKEPMPAPFLYNKAYDIVNIG